MTKNIYGGYCVRVEGISIALSVGITDIEEAVTQAEQYSLVRPRHEHYVVDATNGDVLACVTNTGYMRIVARPVYLVVNGNTGNNLTKKNTRDAAENSAMRWRQTLRALDIPVYVMNSLTGEIVYEAL